MMTIALLRSVLGWSALLNLLLVVVWFSLFLGFHDRMYAWHRRWFRLSGETFDAIHYAGMAWYKIATWLLFILPYVALRISA
ncbi:DUF6868 family protein [Dyella japonica]|nr:hypothetical protein [Dyella japonica]